MDAQAKKILERLKKAQKFRGVSTAGLASALNISRNAIYNWTRKGRSPSMHRIQQLAEVLDVPTDYFIVESDDIAYAMLTGTLAKPTPNNETLHELLEEIRLLTPEQQRDLAKMLSSLRKR